MDKDEEIKVKQLQKELKRGQRVAGEMLSSAKEEVDKKLNEEEKKALKSFEKKYVSAVKNGNMLQAMNIYKEFIQKWQ